LNPDRKYTILTVGFCTLFLDVMTLSKTPFSTMQRHSPFPKPGQRIVSGRTSSGKHRYPGSIHKTSLQIGRASSGDNLTKLIDLLYEVAILPLRSVYFLGRAGLGFVDLGTSLMAKRNPASPVASTKNAPSFRPPAESLHPPRPTRLPNRVQQPVNSSAASARTLDLRHGKPAAPLQQSERPMRRLLQQSLNTSLPPSLSLGPKSPDRRAHSSSTMPEWLVWVSTWSWNRNLASAAVLGSAILLVALGLGYQGVRHSYQSVFAEAMTGQDYLVLAENALRERNIPAAREAFLSAREKFHYALQEVQAAGAIGVIPGVGSRLNSGTLMLEAGQSIAQAGYALTTALDPVQDLLRGEESSQVTANTPLADYTQDLMIALTLARPQIQSARTELEKAAAALEGVNPQNLGMDPAEVTGARERINGLISILEQTYYLSEVLPELIGDNGTRSYLLLFQNTAERRPTGGFIGSFGIMEMYQGRLENFYTENVYGPDGQLEVQGIYNRPPRPVERYLSPNWGMRDANWSPDFPTSARQVANLYQQASGKSVDGVLAITPELLQEVIRVTGPVYMPSWDEIVTADNAINLIQYKVSMEQIDAPDPKLFLIDLSQILFDRLLSLRPEQWTRILEIFHSGLEQKMILIEPFHPKSAEYMGILDWNGRVKPTEDDYLMVINANLASGKTNPFVEERYKLVTNILPDGSVENTLTITYNHHGSWEWPSGGLFTYQRVYLPKGSTLIESTSPVGDDGFKAAITEVFDELDKTVFADYLTIFPGGTVNLSYTYRLPLRIHPDHQLRYRSLIQKQPGTLGIGIEHTIKYDPFVLQPLYTNRELLKQDEKTLTAAHSLNSDKSLEIGFRKHDVL